jgi:hypothetical protein
MPTAQEYAAPDQKQIPAHWQELQGHASSCGSSKYRSAPEPTPSSQVGASIMAPHIHWHIRRPRLQHTRLRSMPHRLQTAGCCGPKFACNAAGPHPVQLTTEPLTRYFTSCPLAAGKSDHCCSGGRPLRLKQLVVLTSWSSSGYCSSSRLRSSCSKPLIPSADGVCHGAVLVWLDATRKLLCLAEVVWCIDAVLPCCCTARKDRAALTQLRGSSCESNQDQPASEDAGLCEHDRQTLCTG